MVRVVGETDISGLKLLEAHLGLDRAAKGLDLTSPNTASPHLYPYPCIFILLKRTPREPTHRALSHKATYTVSRYTLSQTHSPYTDPIATTLSSRKDLIPHTRFPTNTPLSASTTVAPHLFSHYVAILPPFIQQAFLKSCCREDPGNQDKPSLVFALRGSQSDSG